MVGADSMRCAAEDVSALDCQLVGADAVDTRAQGDEEMTKILDVRLTGGVAQDRRAFRAHRRGDGVLCSRDARLIEEDVGTRQAPRCHLDGLTELEIHAHALEREKMCIEASATDDI